MPEFKVTLVPPAYEANPIPLIITASMVIIVISITIYLIRKELKNEKTK